MLTAWPLRVRLLLSFALIVALTLAFGAFALIEMAGLNRDARDIAEDWLPRSQLTAAMKIEVVGVRVAQFQFIAVGEAVEARTATSAWSTRRHRPRPISPGTCRQWVRCWRDSPRAT